MISRGGARWFNNGKWGVEWWLAEPECVGIVLNLVWATPQQQGHTLLPAYINIYASSRCHPSSVHLLYKLLNIVSSKNWHFVNLSTVLQKFSALRARVDERYYSWFVHNCTIEKFYQLKSENVLFRKMGQTHRPQRAFETQVRLLLLRDRINLTKQI